MSMRFNIEEIFEIAEQIERNGAKFYRKAAANTEIPENREMLEGLALMEDRHEKVFGTLRRKIVDSDPALSVFDPDSQAALYLQSFADGYVFDIRSDPSEKLIGGETLRQILKTAIGLEKDSIVFYYGMQEMVPEHLGQDKIGVIIQEEMRHIADLSEALKAIDAKA